MTGKAEGGCFIEAGSEEVAGGLATGGVAAPAAGVHPLSTVAGSEEVVVLLLGAAVVVVEGALLSGCQGKLQFRLHLQALVEFEEAVADVVEDFFQGGVAGWSEVLGGWEGGVKDCKATSVKGV